MNDGSATLDADAVSHLRDGLTDCWAGHLDDDTPHGWSRSGADLAAMVTLCPGLWLRAGWELVAYQFRYGDDGNGVVWAVPEGADLPAPDGADLHDPPRPPRAADDAMAAVDGDGTALSHLAASLLVREFDEVGAAGHGVAWLPATVLDADPWAPGAADMAGPVPHPGERYHWEWYQQPPASWSPQATTARGAAEAVFYTFSALGRQQVVRHRDRGRADSYLAVRERTVVADGPPGFVW